MSVDSGLVATRANPQDMVVSFLRHVRRATESITAPPSGRPRSCWQCSNSHFVAVNVILPERNEVPSVTHRCWPVT